MNHSDPVISFRLTTGQRTLPCLIGFLGAVPLVVAALAVQGERVSAAELGQWTSWALFAVVVVTFLQRGHGVMVTPDALVLVDAGRRRIPWAHVRAVEVRRYLGVQQVVVRTLDGRCRVLRAPMSLGDPEFGAKVDVLMDRWRAGRSTPDV